MPHGYLLIRRAPDGTITSPDTPYRTFAHAAAASAHFLTGQRLAGTAAARLFAQALARRPLGTVWGHSSGWDFRVLVPDLTEDGAAITPGRRLFNYYDREWGTVLPEQFMSETIGQPGDEFFDGWYDFARESDGHVRKFNGHRLATKES